MSADVPLDCWRDGIQGREELPGPDFEVQIRIPRFDDWQSYRGRWCTNVESNGHTYQLNVRRRDDTGECYGFLEVGEHYYQTDAHSNPFKAYRQLKKLFGITRDKRKKVKKKKRAALTDRPDIDEAIARHAKKKRRTPVSERSYIDVGDARDEKGDAA